ncbi:MAG: putative DNA binding domain-containing protein [Candidatus Omnitrophota bacterium]|nr:putative DNA binding domain-containing protein [Candidatus Omnitrophota bacterium]
MITLRESETVEFKRSTAELKKAVISIVAMLNKHGRGEVYFGIDDDGKVLGQPTGRMTLKDIAQAVVDNTEPKVFPKVETKNIDGKDCVVVDAHGINSPYFAYGRAYIRVGESDKALSIHEIEMRILSKKKLLWELEISKKTVADVNEDVVRDFMRKAKTAKRIDFDFVDVKTTLNKLHLFDKKQMTMAAEVLFCDENPIEIQAAIFAGIDKLTFLDIKQFKGNLFSLRQQAEVYVNEHMKWRADLSESRRKEIPEIPVRALSEAIGNSLCHRDFANPKGNEVALFKDRIEIYNPGLFPVEIDPEDFFTGEEHSILRNPLIAEIMYKSKDIERWGSGLKRIHEECVTAGIRVEYKRLKTGFVVVFHRPKWEDGEGLAVADKGIEKVGEKVGEKVTKNQRKILDELGRNAYMSAKDLALAVRISPRKIEVNLQKLKQKGILKRTGPDKGGHWEVSKIGDVSILERKL